MSAMPEPITRRIHSSKHLGLPVAVVFVTLASTRPVKHLICVCVCVCVCECVCVCVCVGVCECVCVCGGVCLWGVCGVLCMWV